MNREEFDKLIASKLRDHTSSVPENVWANVGSHIGAIPQPSFWRKYRYLLLGLLFLAILTIGFLSFKDQIFSPDLNIQPKQEQPVISPNTPVAKENNSEDAELKKGNDQNNMVNQVETHPNEKENVDQKNIDRINEGLKKEVDSKKEYTKGNSNEKAESKGQKKPATKKKDSPKKGSPVIPDPKADDPLTFSPDLNEQSNSESLFEGGDNPGNDNQNTLASAEQEAELVAFSESSLDLIKSVKTSEESSFSTSSSEISDGDVSEFKRRLISTPELIAPYREIDTDGSSLIRDYNSCAVNTNTECYSFTPSIKHIYLDFLMGPAYHIKTLSAKTPESSSYLAMREETEKYLFSFSAEVRASLVWKSGFMLGAGLNYTQLGEKFEYEDPNAMVETIINVAVDTIYIPGGPTTIIWDTLSVIQTGERKVVHQNNYRFVDIPLTVGYELEGEKIMLSVRGGVMFNILFKQNGRILDPNDELVYLQPGHSDSYPAYKSTAGISLIGSLGLAYKLKPTLHLLVEPQFRYVVKSLDLNSYPLEHRVSMTGLSFGLRKVF